MDIPKDSMLKNCSMTYPKKIPGQKSGCLLPSATAISTAGSLLNNNAHAKKRDKITPWKKKSSGALSLRILFYFFCMPCRIFYFNSFQDHFHTSFYTQDTAVQAEMIAVGISPFFAGIIVVITAPLLICFLDPVLCLRCGKFIFFWKYGLSFYPDPHG